MSTNPSPVCRAARASNKYGLCQNVAGYLREAIWVSVVVVIAITVLRAAPCVLKTCKHDRACGLTLLVCVRRAQIVEGRIAKTLKSMSLMEQPYIKDNNKTVELVIKETVAALGEKISVRRFERCAS